MTSPEAVDVYGHALSRLDATTLGQLGDAALLNRVDTKYVVPVGLVPDLVTSCVGTYAALEVSGRRAFTYSTQYFDTEEFALFREHVSGHLPRRKVRIRTYADDGLHVLELKHKSNSGRTEKVRRQIADADPSALSLLDDDEFRRHEVPAPALLRSAIVVTYTRATFVHRQGGERVTIDTGLAYQRDGRSIAFPAVAVVEVKQLRRTRSTIVDALRTARLRPTRLSKYCVGVAAMVASAPRHGYHRLLQRLHVHSPAHVATSAV